MAVDNSQLPGTRLAADPAAAENSIPVFQFVNVRSPRPGATALGLVSDRYITYVDNRSALASQLSNIRAAEEEDAASQLEQMRAAATSAMEEAVEQRDDLRPRAQQLAQLGSWLREAQEGLTAEALAQRPQAEALGDEEVQIVWDVLLGQQLLGASAVAFPDPGLVLRAQQFLREVEDQEADPDRVMELARAELLLPDDIFPLPRPLPTVPEAPAPPADAGVPAQARQLTDLTATVRELRQQQELRQEVARTTPPPPMPSITLAEEGETPSQEEVAAHEAARLAWEAWRAEQAKVEQLPPDENLSATARDVLAAAGLPAQVRLSFAIEYLEKQATTLTTDLSRYIQRPAPVVQTAGGFWSLETEDAQAKGGQPTPTDPLDTRPSTDLYAGFYTPGQLAGRIRPLGIADLNVVEQTLCCYKAGEVAHVENIMQGEYKERTSRRLHRTETTVTTELEREETQERDTISTDRYQLQKETSRLLQKSQALSLGATVTTNPLAPVQVSASANFNTSSSAQSSDRQTADYAREITDRSLQRIIERVREQRTTTVTDEYEENNKHGLDNRGGDRHVVGLYRWVDMLYRMQVVNYGKRLMFEFMVPNPGRIHLWAMLKTTGRAGSSLRPPLPDPRTTDLRLSDNSSKYRLISADYLNTTNYAFWAAAYGATVEAPPAEFKYVGISIDGSKTAPAWENNRSLITGRPTTPLEVPAGYEAVEATMRADFRNSAGNGEDPGVAIYVGDGGYWATNNGSVTSTGEIIQKRGGVQTYNMSLRPLTGVIPVAYQGMKTEVIIITITIKCRRTDATYQNWQLKTFNAILEAYQAQQDAYDQALAAAKAEQEGIGAIRGTNPAQNRLIERTELKRGCLNWLFNGANFGVDGTHEMGEGDINPPVYKTGADLVGQTERAKFMEQCFEWDLLAYTLYPYFWLPRDQWHLRYQFSDADPQFLNFLQSGLARVLVSVRPGYERAAMHFLKYGQIWNGGSPPAINSPLYRAIIDELRPQPRTLVGPSWQVRVPSTLTVLQAESGAIEGRGLPCDCEPGEALGREASVLIGKE